MKYLKTVNIPKYGFKKREGNENKKKTNEIFFPILRGWI